MVVLEKDRIIYELDGVRVVIDDIKGFKIGIELEVVTNKDRKIILPKLMKIAKKIGLDTKDEITERSVTFLYMEKFAKFFVRHQLEPNRAR